MASAGEPAHGATTPSSGGSRARDALTIARATADKGGEANALDIMGLMLWRAARYTEALDHHSEALSIWRALGDRHGEADALWHTAIALWLRIAHQAPDLDGRRRLCRGDP